MSRGMKASVNNSEAARTSSMQLLDCFVASARGIVSSIVEDKGSIDTPKNDAHHITTTSSSTKTKERIFSHIRYVSSITSPARASPQRYANFFISKNSKISTLSINNSGTISLAVASSIAMTQPGLRPTISPIHIGITGLIAFIAASLWPPILFIVSILLALIAPSLFFENDPAEGRRRLYKLFLRYGDLPEAMKCNDVDLEENYWTNSRGMLLATSILRPKAGTPIKA
eukprot:scaffold29063_cov67-Skeletonema_dohrnii-CCMP3373.AAC.2